MRLRKIGLVVTLGLAIVWAPPASDAQQPGKVHRIGYLSGTGATAALPVLEAFRQGLREQGYVEGKNIVIEYRWADGRLERLPDLAAELVRLKVDVIFAVTPPPVLAARGATQIIPIISAMLSDPVESGLVASLARPGGNITGLTSTAGPGMVGKRLELLKEAVPKVSRVAILSNPTTPAQPRLLSEAKVAARSLRVRLHLTEARSPDEFDGAFAAMARERAGALLVLADPMSFLHRTRLADLAKERRLPTMHDLREYVEAGGLMSYGVDLTDNWRRAAVYVDKILKGAKPADLPIQQPTNFELVINLRTAKALGLTIPQIILFRATDMIQ